MGRLESAEDNQRVMIKIQPVGDHGDAWSELERSDEFAYSVSHQHNESGMLFVRGCRGELKGIEEKMPDGFVYAGFEED